jgi:hypothetical protein
MYGTVQGKGQVVVIEYERHHASSAACGQYDGGKKEFSEVCIAI